MNLKLTIFGKEGCELCEQTQKKIEHFLNKWDLTDEVTLAYWDTTTVDGDAEASFYDVADIPATLVERDGEEVARWVGPASNLRSEDLRSALTGAPA